MRSFSRREFVLSGSAIALPLFLRAQAADNLPSAMLKVGSETGSKVPADFLGVSWETIQLEDAAFFAPENVSLVQQFRSLGARGVLRLGGNSSEFGWWKATADAAAPTQKAIGSEEWLRAFAITPKAIDNLDGFLKATGWSCIYGLNLGNGAPEAAAVEAAYVAKRLERRLQYFQIGNEADLFKGRLRDAATWNVDTYLSEWLAMARAVQKAVPEARFGLPDVASEMSWLTRIAERWTSLEDRPKVAAMTHHYYRSGPPSNPDANVENLLKADQRVASQGAIAKAAAAAMGLPCRVTEANSIYDGGKDGVSNVFAAALWSAEYLFRLMQEGYCGVNLHGGSGQDAGKTHPTPFYTPIGKVSTTADGKAEAKYALQPAGQGMKFAASFQGVTMVPVTLDAGALNVSAYAGRRADGKVIVAILNKEASSSVRITAPIFDTIQVMTAPSLEAREAHVTTVVSETSSRRTTEGQTFTLPAHMATLIVLH